MGKLIVWLVAACAFLFAAPSFAAGRIVVPRGAVLDLVATPSGYETAFDVRNDSDDPLFVSRIAPRTDADDIRLPKHVVARFQSGQTSGTIPPHGTARVHVTWTPERDTRLRAFYGHVMITSTDEGAGEVAVGIALRDPNPLRRHVVSSIVSLPLLASVVLALLLVAFGGGRTGRAPRVVALAASLASAALAIAAWAWFDPELSRASGNDGYQLVERAAFARSIGVELFLGVDGVSLPLIVLAAVAAPCGVLASWKQRQNPSLFFAFYMLLTGASLGALVALDAFVFAVCLAIAIASAFMLVGLFGRGDARTAASRMFVLAVLGLAAYVVALGALHGASTRVFLVDGTPSPHAWTFAELARVDFAASRASLFGAPLAKSALVLSLVGLGLASAAFPFHAWLSAVARSAPPAVSAMIAIGMTRAAMLGLVRTAIVVLPESFRWSAPVIGTIAAAGALYAAFVAIAERDLASIASMSLVALSSVAIASLCALSPEALLGAVSAIATSGAAVAAAMLALGALHERTATLDTRALRGLGIESPRLALALGASACACGAVPGFATFWSAWLASIGAVVREPGFAAAVLVALVVLSVSQVSPLMRVVRGRLPESLRGSQSLAPWGGHVPDLRAREIAALAPLVLLVLALGLYPAPLLGRAANTVRDLITIGAGGAGAW
jgi:NADH-quinone oxidoreductase subunit M